MKKITFIISIILCFIIGWKLSDLYFVQLVQDNIQFQVKEPTGQFKMQFLFSLAFGIIPILYAVVKKLTEITKIKHQLLAIGMIVVSGIFGWQFRVLSLKRQFNIWAENSPPDNSIKNAVYVDSLFITEYLFFGMVMGAVISIIVFRMNTKPQGQIQL